MYAVRHNKLQCFLACRCRTCVLEVNSHGVRLAVEAEYPPVPGHLGGDGADVDDILFPVLFAAVYQEALVL